MPEFGAGQQAGCSVTVCLCIFVQPSHSNVGNVSVVLAICNACEIASQLILDLVVVVKQQVEVVPSSSCRSQGVVLPCCETRHDMLLRKSGLRPSAAETVLKGKLR